MTNVTQQKRVYEGVHRLSVFAGSIGAFAWLIFAGFESNAFSNISPKGWTVVVLGAFVAFLVPFALVRGTAWVVRGFRQ